ncbi:MAG: YgfZ/GcvT domain-containing protein [Terriglobales bacterium]
MQLSPLADFYRSHGGTLAPYRGSLSRQDGGEPALLGPGWPAAQLVLYDLSWRAVLAIEGPEARKWLNGMLTANVRDLEPGQLAPSFQLDPKGHVLAMLDVACTGPEQFLLLTEEDQRAGLEARLRRYVFIAKLTIEDRSPEWCGLRLRGPRWRALWEQLQLPVERRWVSAPGGVEQAEWAGPAAEVAALWRRLQPAALAAGSAVFERDRILSRQPAYGRDIGERELPQETGEMERVSFTKGCYVGQEIVERIRARGAVHRRLRAMRFDSAVAPDAEVCAGGRPAGALTSAVPLEDGAWMALGYLRDAAPGAAVTSAGADGVVLE